MALKNQVANVYGVGINNVGSYQVAGRPFCMTGSVTEEDEITFPQVTKQVTVMNRDSSNDIYVYFSASAPDANKFKIASGDNQFTFNVKCETSRLNYSFSLSSCVVLKTQMLVSRTSYLIPLTNTNANGHI